MMINVMIFQKCISALTRNSYKDGYLLLLNERRIKLKHEELFIRFKSAKELLVALPKPASKRHGLFQKLGYPFEEQNADNQLCQFCFRNSTLVAEIECSCTNAESLTEHSVPPLQESGLSQLESIEARPHLHLYSRVFDKQPLLIICRYIIGFKGTHALHVPGCLALGFISWARSLQESLNVNSCCAFWSTFSEFNYFSRDAQ